ncbi:MAG: diaminopimelate epimerase [Elusimicrobia bacterium]|nr:diaminopimelate epimerase [Elusimicrobiota bacterium]
MMRFYKLSGAGNDFVLIRRPPGRLPALARRLCDRRGGIGADGLLAVSPAGLRVDYLNADGSPAFCGNGARCAALWMHDHGWTKGLREFSMKTSQGRVLARVLGREKVSLRMPAPSTLRLGLRLEALGRRFKAHALDTGVPHAVVPVDDLDHFPVVETGRALRHHRAFGRAGANVDFIRVTASEVRLRTYERGVEDETLACGTGVVAAAIVARRLSRLRPPIRVRVRSGESLMVRFDGGAALPSEVWLEGPCRQVFTGEIDA